MLDGIMNFFDWVVTTVELLLDFLWNVIDSFTTLLTAIAGAITLPPLLVGFIPGVVGSCLISITAIAVAKLIAGR